MADHEDDLAASKTEGFKLGEKKTIAEYNELGTWYSPSSMSTSTCIPLAGFAPYLLHLQAQHIPQPSPNYVPLPMIPIYNLLNYTLRD